jgi:prepilin-type N-terminal cleavage/methylation domain-containing protein
MKRMTDMEKYLIRKFHKSMAGSRGYTLMELLAVIAILAVLLGIAVPSVVSVSGALKFAQRNDHARRIFLAAQANLTRLRAEGRLIYLRKEAEMPFRFRKTAAASRRRTGPGSMFIPRLPCLLTGRSGMPMPWFCPEKAWTQICGSGK